VAQARILHALVEILLENGNDGSCLLAGEALRIASAVARLLTVAQINEATRSVADKASE